MFIVVDVETSHTIATPGNLLSIGAVAVSSEAKIVDKFYQRIAYLQETADASTVEWWKEQGEQAYEEAWSWEKSRVHPLSVANLLKEWVNRIKGDEPAFFAANPVSFDYPWVDLLFKQYGVESPFSTRTLCLRSMRYGMFGGEFGGERTNYSPEVKHHALYDALAEAEDLIEMMNHER